jgi:hypothetical protein
LALLVASGGSIHRADSFFWLLVWCGYGLWYLAMVRLPVRFLENGLRMFAGVAAALPLAAALRQGLRPEVLALNPNAYASLLLLLLPWMSGPWVLLGLAALGITGSRGAWLAWLAAVVVLRGDRRAKIATLIIAPALVAALIWIRPETIVARWEVWSEAVTLFAQRPFIGWGPGCYHWLSAIEPGKSHPDNALLAILAEQGLVGATAWLWAVNQVVKRVATSGERRGQLALAAFGLHQWVDSTFFNPLVGITALAILALQWKSQEVSNGRHS